MYLTSSHQYSLFPGQRFVELKKLNGVAFHNLSLTQYIWYSALNYFSNPWALIILLYLVYRLKLKPKSSITILNC